VQVAAQSNIDEQEVDARDDLEYRQRFLGGCGRNSLMALLAQIRLGEHAHLVFILDDENGRHGPRANFGIGTLNQRDARMACSLPRPTKGLRVVVFGVGVAMSAIVVVSVTYVARQAQVETGDLHELLAFAGIAQAVRLAHAVQRLSLVTLTPGHGAIHQSECVKI